MTDAQVGSIVGALQGICVELAVIAFVVGVRGVYNLVEVLHKALVRRIPEGKRF